MLLCIAEEAVVEATMAVEVPPMRVVAAAPALLLKHFLRISMA
jgi:hypothetical protein